MVHGVDPEFLYDPLPPVGVALGSVSGSVILTPKDTKNCAMWLLHGVIIRPDEVRRGSKAVKVLGNLPPRNEIRDRPTQ
jgi:hypothetical protein